MAGTGAYAMPVDLPLVTKKNIKKTMSKEAKAHFDYLASKSVDLFTDEQTGELFAKTTDMNSGKSEIRKCIYTNED